ncbi:hypothetical protein AsAng_0028030 [Aureispira anguillae]|uniref:Uncharacterized protein n=1 Tax=Aureispira anguillae TaxID=2864201 RepID=A0A915YFC2_9BACT|nr:hypothetical protein AsAng_0028030 [Aureispira anguillae]
MFTTRFVKEPKNTLHYLAAPPLLSSGNQPNTISLKVDLFLVLLSYLRVELKINQLLFLSI